MSKSVEEDIDIAIAVFEESMDSDTISALRPLTDGERACLYAVLASANDDEYSEKKIAKRAGVSRVTLWRARQNPKWQYALTLALMRGLRGEVELGIRALRQKVRDGNMQAIKLWLELCEVWHPVNRVMSMNLNVEGKDLRGLPAEDMKKEVTREWRRMGWTKEQFLAAWQATDNEAAKRS